MRLTIVRHAHAGARSVWDGPDELRPLDELGAAQAAALAPQLAALGPVGRLVSSPTLRCVQTLRPLAGLLGVPIGTWAALAPHGGASELRAILGHPAFDDAILCTHGEVLRPLLRTLRPRGFGRHGVHPRGRRVLAKGSAWCLTIEADGTVSSFEHLPPLRPAAS